MSAVRGSTNIVSPSDRWRRGATLLDLMLAIVVGPIEITRAAAPTTGANRAKEPGADTSGEVRGWSLPYRKDGDLKARLSGASARPISGGELEIRDLKVETFHDGEPQATLTTPLCRYRAQDDSVMSTNVFAIRLPENRGKLDGEGFHLLLAAKEVSSPGNFSASGPGGRLQLRGEGFRFRMESGQLTVSNRVQALLPIRIPKRLSL